MSFAHIEYQYPIAHLFQKMLLWVNKNCDVYFALKLNEEDNWTYYAGNASHELEAGEILTSYGASESSAQTYYLTTEKDENGKVLTILPANFQAKYVRVYIKEGDNVTVYEWTPSTFFTANEIVAGELLISDKLSDSPWIRVQAAGVDRVKLGKVGSYYGLYGYNASGEKIFELSDDLQKVGGWTFTDSTLSCVASGEGLILDAANKIIKSQNYVSGTMGSGFNISSDLIEVGNISARGLFKCTVFEKETVNAVGGNLLVTDSDVLDSDMSALDSSSLIVKGDVTFDVGDILRIKSDASNDEWLEVTDNSSAPTYTVTRDKSNNYSANNNPVWPKGSAVVNYHMSGESGLIYLTASDTNAPYMSVVNHSGAPWTNLHTRLRIGNLNGYLGYVSDTFGIGIGGVASGECNLTYDQANGLRLRTTTVDKISLDNYGNVWFSDKLTLGKENVSSGRIVLEIADGHGDSYIAGGKTDFTNAESGFILGLDDSDSNKAKFYIGNSANYLNWDGAELFVKGDIAATSGYFQNVTLGKTGVTSGVLTLQLNDGGGDTYISYGKTDFTNVDTGFILGIDDSDDDKAKFYVGNSSKYFNWDGTGITLVGDFKTGLSGERLEFLTSDNKLHFYNSDSDEQVVIGSTSAATGMTLNYLHNAETARDENVSPLLIYLEGSTLGTTGRYNRGVAVLVTSTRSSGSLDIINYGIHCIVSGAQKNYGGCFEGSTGPIVLEPGSSSSAPSHSAKKGTLWVTSAGVLYINTNGSTTWAKVGGQ